MKKKLVEKLGKSMKDATNYTSQFIGKNKNIDPHMSINELLEKPKREEEKEMKNYQSHFNELKEKMEMQKNRTMEQMKNLNKWDFRKKEKIMKPLEAMKDKVEDKFEKLEENIEKKMDKFKQNM